MDKIFAVVRREFIERVRTRAFVIGTLLGPLLLGGIMFLPMALSRGDTATRWIVIIDQAGGTLGTRVEAALRGARLGTGEAERARYRIERVETASVERVRDSLLPRIGLRDEVAGPDGLLILTSAALDSDRVDYLGSNVASPADMQRLRQLLQPVVVAERLVRQGVDPALVETATARVELATSKVSAGKLTGASGGSSFALAYATGFILYFALLLYGVQVMTSTIEEKTSRIMEVLVSSMSPFQLLLGKVIGVGTVGLVQLGIWIGAAMALSANFGRLAGRFSAPEEAATAAQLPAISPGMVVVFLTFFVLGFFLFASMYAAVGAMCSTTQEAQQATTPVSLIIVCGFMVVFGMINDPDGALARVVSLIPFTAPFAVPVRYSLTPIPTWEILLSVATTVLGMLAMVWVAARIYRVGILAYGKRPTVGELWRWVRTG